VIGMADDNEVKEEAEAAGLPLLEHAVTHIGKPPVERSREEVDLVTGMATKLTRYDRLVEDAVAEKLSLIHI